jgi:uncharacterized protein (TIGR03435 family)
MRFAVVLMIIASPVLADGQPAPVAVGPQFEVASVKANTSGGATRVDIGGGRFSTTNVSVRDLLKLAFPIDGHLRNDRQIVGGPDWLGSTRFDIVATGAPASLGAPVPGSVAPPESPALNELRAMLQHLLIDRFSLAVHHENRDLPIYGLTRLHGDRLGPQLRISNADCAAERKALGGHSPAADQPGCGAFKLLGSGQLAAHAITTPMLVALLAAFPGVLRPVEDRTGLADSFDLTLMWTPEPRTQSAGDAGAAATGDGPSIFTAVQEQLGLKLEPDNRPTDVLVIDRVEPPSSN